VSNRMAAAPSLSMLQPTLCSLRSSSQWAAQKQPANIRSETDSIGRAVGGIPGVYLMTARFPVSPAAILARCGGRRRRLLRADDGRDNNQYPFESGF
jgi:hypothetical protein